MSSQVLVTLLVSGVFRDEVEVFSADDQGSVHLGRDDLSGQDTAADGDHSREWAFLVCADTRSAFFSPPVGLRDSSQSTDFSWTLP